MGHYLPVELIYVRLGIQLCYLYTPVHLVPALPTDIFGLHAQTQKPRQLTGTMTSTVLLANPHSPSSGLLTFFPANTSAPSSGLSTFSARISPTPTSSSASATSTCGNLGSVGLLPNRTLPYCGATFRGTRAEFGDTMRLCCSGATVFNPWENNNDTCVSYCDAVGHTMDELAQCIRIGAAVAGDKEGVMVQCSGSNHLFRLRGTFDGIILAVVLGASVFAAFQ